MLKHQGLDGQQFSLGPKGERLKFQTSMPSRQLVALGLKVKDSNSKKMTESALAGAVYPVLGVWTGLSMKANTNTFSIRS